jgi:hypothetical protein
MIKYIEKKGTATVVTMNIDSSPVLKVYSSLTPLYP